MRRQLIGPAFLVMLALGACGPFGHAWPDAYRQSVCAATADLRAAHTQLTSVIAAVQSPDAERVAVGAAGMEREAGDARAALDGAAAWPPGAELAKDLGLAATGFARAAGQFDAGARQGNGPALDAAVAYARDAEAAVARAAVDGERLRANYGWQLC